MADEGTPLGHGFNPGVCAARGARVERLERDVSEMKQDVRKTSEGLSELVVEMRADRDFREREVAWAKEERKRSLEIIDKLANSVDGIEKNVGKLEVDVYRATEREAGRSKAFGDLRTWVLFFLAVIAFALGQVIDRVIGYLAG